MVAQSHSFEFDRVSNVASARCCSFNEKSHFLWDEFDSDCVSIIKTWPIQINCRLFSPRVIRVSTPHLTELRLFFFAFLLFSFVSFGSPSIFFFFYFFSFFWRQLFVSTVGRECFFVGYESPAAAASGPYLHDGPVPFFFFVFLFFSVFFFHSRQNNKKKIGNEET